MKRAAILLMMLLLATAASGHDMPMRFHCRQLGVWYCGDEGVCLDGARGGPKYAFSLGAMIFKSDGVKGRIVRRESGSIYPSLILDDGRRLTYFDDRTEGKRLVQAYLGKNETGPHSFAELRCSIPAQSRH